MRKKLARTIRKTAIFMLIIMMAFGMATTAFAAISSVKVDQTVKTITEGTGSTVFKVTVTNNSSSTARETTFSIEGNGLISDLSSFSPAKIDLGKKSTAQVDLIINSSSLEPGSYHFSIVASAPAIAGRGQSGQTASAYTSDQITLTVEGAVVPDPIPVSGVSISESDQTITVADTVQLNAMVEPGDATNKDVTWTSNSIKAIVDETGLVTGVSVGEAVITVTTIDGGFTDSITMTVEEEQQVQPIDPVVDQTIEASSVEEESPLSDSVLSGTFKDPDKGTVVSGTLSWTDSSQIVQETGNFQWTFTPDDTNVYNIINGVVEVVATSPPPAPTAIHYVALGDSLVTGSTSRGTTTSYVYGFRSFLENQYDIEVTMENLGTDGDDSSDLLAKLSNETFSNKVRNADIITISIGGNNVMHAAYNYFSAINETAAEEGTNRFENEYALIIARIRELNPEAQIISMTLYNPYNTISIRGYEDDPRLHNIAKTYIDRINTKINGILDANYYVADVHSSFLQYAERGAMGDLTYFYPNRYFKFTRDPHANQTGQNLFRSLHEQLYNQIISSNRDSYLMVA
ncbi:MAG: GDSL-type esterase/lipase family protein [Eubacteriales bacterium]|nr:GDSL-type esterase/lipase family protein [Eubacteriales bacterium]